jgi:NTE family protein
LCRLRDEGREAARSWLARNFGQIGKSSTVDLAGMFL